jgi:hypothetical protein
LAQCLRGDGATSASAFVAAHPRSPLRDRMAKACVTREGQP